jgi:hypothetical protein
VVFKGFIAAASAVALAASPALASANSPIRTAAPAIEAEESELFGTGGAGGFIIPLLAIAAIILGILAATAGDGDDLPTSP